MKKNIAIFCDGTWNDKDDRTELSNVALMHEQSVNDPLRQVTFYLKGVGTNGWYDAKLGGIHGYRTSENIREAYKFLIAKYKPGDSVFLFGFSRGAYVARSLAGLVYRCGLPARPVVTDLAIETIYDLYVKRDYDAMAESKNKNRMCPISFLGVWDTVGALGIPIAIFKKPNESLFGFHDTALSPEVGYACHAVALDEQREAFEPTLWDVSDDNAGFVHQVWFAGAHSDVGGGYKERHHSNTALKWMISHASKPSNGLLMRNYPDDSFPSDHSQPVHDSTYKIHLFKKIELGAKPRRVNAESANGNLIHRSVLEDLKLKSDYIPRGMVHEIVNRESLDPYSLE